MDWLQALLTPAVLLGMGGFFWWIVRTETNCTDRGYWIQWSSYELCYEPTYRICGAT